MRYDTSIEIKEFDSVYPVREDSILLIESLDVTGHEKVLEIGCGSGVVSLHCAKNGCDVTAVDINPSAVDATTYNAELNSVSIRTGWSDVYSGVDGRFDIIVFNLPYLPTDDDGAEAMAWSGGADGLGPLPRVLDGTKEHLNEDGRVVVVVSSLMDQARLETLLSGLSVKVLKELALFFERLRVLEIRVPS